MKSKLAQKRVSVIATNQVRENPRQLFGNPEYQVGGQALHFYSDARINVRAVSAPGGKGAVEEEDCWDEVGVDKYKYVNITVEKNKMFSPFRKAQLRIWFESKGRPGYGFDRVFDTYTYLIETGQAEVARKITLTIPGIWTQCTWKFAEFKYFILNPNKLEVYQEFNLKDKDLDAAIKDIKTAKTDKKRVSLENRAKRLAAEKLDLVKACWEQIKNGLAFEYYFNTISGVDNDGMVSIESSSFNKKCGNCIYWSSRKKFNTCIGHIKNEKDTLACDYWEYKDIDSLLDEEGSKKKKKGKKKKKK